MIKRLLTCLFLLISAAAMAQKKAAINVTKSDRFSNVSPTLAKVYKGTFTQQYSVLTADSALIYSDQNSFDAFGHVTITQGDTIHIYADNLHYDDNTKIALLTNNVRLVDKDATLTTNWLNYDTKLKIGTYINGGKIVSKDGKNTLTSQNGYYYGNSRDVYFRYNVISTSPDALINTDTMRYNSGTRITYFYGPTHIYGKKDKDTLYTENGNYNTKTEQAFFGKRNRYSQGTKSLKGDSLFYDKLKGYGRAIKNITYEDTEQHMILKGDLGEFYKANDRAVVTQNPYVILVSEEKDTTKKAVAVSPPSPPKAPNDVAATIKDASKIAQNLTLADTALIPKPARTKADSLAKIIAKQPAVKNTMPVATSKIADSLKKAAASIGANSLTGKTPGTNKNVTAKTPPAKGAATPAKPTVVTGNNKPIKAATEIVYTGVDNPMNRPAPVVKDSTSRIKRDTMYIGADTLETQMVTFKYLKDLQEQRRLAGIRDTSAKARKPFVPYTLKTLPKNIELVAPKLVLPPPDFLNKPLPYLPKPVVDSAKILADKKLAAQKATKDSADKKAAVKPGDKTAADANVKGKTGTDAPKVQMTKADSLKAGIKPPLSDTSRVRILSAHHNVKIFKSDLQGKSDSLFYSSADSIIRSYQAPMYWTQGAQLSGDTILLQLKNQKADNMEVFPKAFVVYLEKNDSTHFNQMGGKRLHAWFKDSKISKVTVNGNAETIYFSRKEKTGEVSEMERSISSGITINFKKGEVTTMGFYTKPEHKITPIAKVIEDDKLLKNFIWKPKERPASKEDVIHPKKKAAEKPADKPKDAKAAPKGAATKGTPAKTPAAKQPVNKSGAKTAVKDSSAVIPAAKDTSNKGLQKLVIPLKKGEQDSLLIRQPGVPQKVMPPVKPDTTKNKP